MRYIDLEKLINSKRSRWGNANDLWTGEKIKEDFRNYFGGKCWYCECDIAGSDMPIDHFRPKNEVRQYMSYNYNRKIANNGYYWLKDIPENYRGSCTYSNSRRGAGGKECFFPLKDTSGYMAVGDTDTSVEEPMLLDPCVKDDVKLLTFVSALPACSTNNEEDEKRVNASIELYNLNDGYIMHRRKQIWDDAMDAIDDYERGGSTETVCIKRLNKLIDRDKPYSSTAIAAVLSWDNEDIKKQLDLEL